jgi:hypothetical protein
MSLSAGLGFSTHDHVVEAVRSAAMDAREQWARPVVVLAFTTHPVRSLMEACLEHTRKR